VLDNAEREAEERARYALPERPAPTGDEPLNATEQRAEELLEEARRTAAYRASPTGQAERQIALLERVVELLEKQDRRA
jgi:hypothetical protein